MSVGNPAHITSTEGLTDCLGHALGRLGMDLHQRDTALKVQDRPALVGGGTDGTSGQHWRPYGMKAQVQSTFPWLFWAWCVFHRLELACKPARMLSLAHFSLKSVKCCFVCTAYTVNHVTHLTALVSDSTVKAADQARLNGYLQKWTRVKAADQARLNGYLQKWSQEKMACWMCDGVDIVQGIKHI